MAVDPVLREALRNDLLSITEEMAIAIEKAGRSPMLRIGYFAAGLADRSGSMIGLPTSSPLFTTVFASVMSATLARWDDDFARQMTSS